MDKETLRIQHIPAVLYGEASKRVFLFVHGKNGFKEEAEGFAEIVRAAGWQVLAVGLPCHGERRGESTGFTPWNVVPELRAVMNFAKCRWK